MSETVDQYGERVTHLHCTQCNDRVGVARLDSVAHLVCHCTHVDGDLKPVKLEGPAAMIRIREPWAFLENGDGRA
jgi:hypothetical protein